MLNIEVIPVTPLMQNCRLVQCTDTNDAVIVDPGGDVDVIIDRIASANAKLKEIWITHCHFDHVGGVAELAEQLNVPIVGSHIKDEPMLALLSPLSMQFMGVAAKSYTPTKWLDEGDTVSVGDYSFEVFFTPGHCPGHVVFYNAENNTLLGGDVLFQGSIGRTDLPGSNHQDLIDSVRDKLFLLPNETKILCGHGPDTSIAAERQNNPFVADRLFK